MAAAQCEISFEIDYTSSIPITSANSTTTASYEIHGSGNPINIGTIDPNGITILPPIQTPGNYDLTVQISAGGVLATRTDSFQIGNCYGNETRIIFYNHAKRTLNGDSFNTLVNFVIRKNGEIVVDSRDANTQYDSPIDKWKSFEAKVGDRIEFLTDLIKSATDGKTTGDMFTFSTTGTSGTVNGTNPTASGLQLLNSQAIGPNNGTKRIFAFVVAPKVNYALGTDFFQ